jgi:hypothetical protein
MAEEGIEDDGRRAGGRRCACVVECEYARNQVKSRSLDYARDDTL